MIVISDEDVRFAANSLGCEFDEEHGRFLKQNTSCDLHAGPGSGKTTLLVAKLAILARNWAFRDRGILVLSHTNVARSEVSTRLLREPSGARLLAYPHFIGTIQGFVDRFLALPHLRSGSVQDFRIDDELFAQRAASRFYGGAGWTHFPKSRGYLRQRYPHDEGRSIVQSLRYQGANLALAADTSTVPSPGSPSGKELLALKEAISVEGVFRYADMFAYAARALRDQPALGPALRHRFPMVYVDEMQDTSKEQEEFLLGIFGVAGCVLCRLGDRNQSIFGDATDGEDDQASFQWATSIDLPKSQRLAPKLAELVTPLAVVHPIDLKGSERRTDRRHTVFVFDDSNIGNVLPAFGDLILEQWPEALPTGFVAKAVGCRKSFDEKRPLLPGVLSDYWPGFEAAPTVDRPSRTRLIRAVRHAQRTVQDSGEYFGGYRTLVEALARIVALVEGRHCSRQSLVEECGTGLLFGDALNQRVSEMLKRDCALTRVNWNVLVKALLVPLGPKSPLPDDARSYLGWEEPHAAVPANPGSRFVHRVQEREVSIEVATIHRVKGETHDATLVLETFNRTHDLRLAVPYLVGAKSRPTKPREVEHFKRLFVGATRPKELLCLAIHQNGIDDAQMQALESRGWTVQNV